MTTRLLQLTASAVLTVMLSPAANAGAHSRIHYDPYAAAHRTAICTQAELSAGIDADDCGRVIHTAADARSATRPTAD